MQKIKDLFSTKPVLAWSATLVVIGLLIYLYKKFVK